MNTPQMLEDLSAMIDGELDASRSAFLLRRLGHDQSLRAASGCYHLIGDCLRRDRRIAPVGEAFAGRVSAALASEPAQPAVARHGQTAVRRAAPADAGAQHAHWLRTARWAAGFATATIVAAGAFWHVQSGVDDSLPLAASESAAPASEVASSGVRIDDLRRQLPLLPVSARQSRPLSPREFAPQPDPQAWQDAQVASLHHLPATQYIIVLPAQRSGSAQAGDAH